MGLRFRNARCHVARVLWVAGFVATFLTFSGVLDRD
jgi:hypothetical protein